MLNTWSLRRKFGLLALIYISSITANLLLAAFCINLYFHSAFLETEVDSALERQIERLWTLAREQRMAAEEAGAGGTSNAEVAAVQDELDDILAQMDPAMTSGSLRTLWASIRQAASRATAGRTPAQDSADRGDPVESVMPPARLRALLELETLLVQANAALHQRERSNIAKVADVRRSALSTLAIDGLLGMVLCTLGPVLARRWVIRPIADLHEATRQLAGGNFAHRLHPRAGDELGLLAAEVNAMSTTMMETRTRAIERERLSAAGETVAQLAHRIRSQLAHIGALTQAFGAPHRATEETNEFRHRIHDTIARFDHWLDDLQKSMSPLELKLMPADIHAVLSRLLDVMQPLLGQRGIRADMHIHGDMRMVIIDPPCFEQALVALVTNAVQASRQGQRIRIEVTPRSDGAGRWQVSVADNGVGIPQDLLEKIFLPHFTTRRDGTGVGLSLANKVIRLHGGQLEVESEPGRGSRFTASLQGMIPLEA